MRFYSHRCACPGREIHPAVVQRDTLMRTFAEDLQAAIILRTTGMFLLLPSGLGRASYGLTRAA